MKKTVLYLLLVVSMLLSACSDSTTATTPADSNTPDTPEPAAVEPTTQTLGPAMDCTVISQEPTPGPTAESLFPPVSENDSVRGPETASVTIIEYSDFQ